tara:strand:+ start:118 stop:339 length:222 start_codon:yes stop_codon:yes gene_type:complete
MERTSEYKFWDLKPPWCQPWTIVSFGILVLISSWLIFQSLIITSVVTIFISLWWGVFLILAPNLYGKSSNSEK